MCARTRYGKGVSPFFKRKKSQQSASHVPEPELARSVQSAQSAPSPDEVAVEFADDVVQPAPIAASDPQTREQLLDEAFARWHAELAVRAQKADETTSQAASGIIDLTHPHPTGSVAFSAGSPVRITSLVREHFAQQRAVNNLCNLQATTQRIAEMYGHAPVSLAVGRLTWTELPPAPASAAPTNVEFAELTGEFRIDENGSLVAVDSATPSGEIRESNAYDADEGNIGQEKDGAGREGGEPGGGEPAPGASEATPRVAQIVREAALFRSVAIEFEEGDATVQQLGHTDINPVFVRALRENGATAEQLAQLNNAVATTPDLDYLLELVRGYGKKFLPGFTFDNEVLLGCFARPGRTMLADLEAMEPYIRTSGVMMALAGDLETRRLSASPLPPGGEEDRAPEVERGAGDLDVAELNAVEAVASGRSIVVDCPPGSQRVQTVASICADAAASKRSVVVVPARLSSGRQLIAELDRLGLGDLILDFSAVEKVPQRIRTGLRLKIPQLSTEKTVDLRAELVETRRQLETFVGDLHRVDDEWGTSIHSLLEKLAGLMARPDAPTTRVRLGKTAVAAMKNEGVEAVIADLNRAAELGAFDPAIARSAWAASTISNATDGQNALDQVRRLRDITIPAAISQSSRSAGETSMKQSKTLAAWFEQIDVLDGIADSLDTFLPRIFETSPMNLVIATASKEWRESHGHVMKMSERRRYKKQALDMVRPGESTATLHEDLRRVQQRREIWRRYCADGGWPTLPDGLAQMRATRQEVQRDLESLQDFLGGEAFFDMDFDELQARLTALVNDADHMSTLPERNATLASLRERGFADFIDDMVERGIEPSHIAAELDLAYTTAVFEEIIATTPTVASLSPLDINALLEKFRQLDRAHTQTLWGPVLRAVVNNARETMQSRRQDTLRLDETLAENGAGGLRDAIATYSRLVQSARPVWVVPATVLAEFIPPMPWADLVIVEASDSVAPLISPMMRGRQAVVVADLHRPGAEDVRVFEQVLPVTCLPTLKAEHDVLSAYALKEIGYDISAIPSVHEGRESRLVFVDGRGVPSASGDGAVESTQVELDAVVDAVIEHAIARPQEALAVVALSAGHANRIRDAIAAADSSDVKRLKEFVVTDITHAAGLRSDHVILSVGYGKTVHGRVLHTFGALATPAGLAGLIDAIAAASSDFTVISALGPGDIDTHRVSTPGPKLLARLINESDGSDVTKVTYESAVTPLLADVAHRLNERGWQTRAAYGYEDSPRIPLVVGKDGEFTVAVVLDDEAYVAERSMRRRDRFWIQALQARGWSVFQTFSSSLFIDPAGQADAIEALLLERHQLPGEPIQVPIIADDVVVSGDVEDAATERTHEAKVSARPRGPRPDVVPGLSLAAYTDDQLDDMIQWIATDGQARSEDEFVQALRSELGIARKGEQVDVILRNVARRSGLIGVAVAAASGDDATVTKAPTAEASGGMAAGEPAVESTAPEDTESEDTAPVAELPADAAEASEAEAAELKKPSDLFAPVDYEIVAEQLTGELDLGDAPFLGDERE